MASFYHGSYARYVVQGGVFHIRQWIKSVRRRLKDLANPQSEPQLLEHLTAYRRSVSQRNWRNVLREVEKISALAEARADGALLGEMAAAFERLGELDRSAILKLESRRLRKGARPREWTGADLSGQTLLIEFVENAKQSIGSIIRHARFVAAAAGRAEECSVLAEERLVPIFRRSFPGVKIHAMGVDDDGLRAQADAVAGVEELAALFARDADSLGATFVPLRAHEELTTAFRSKYRTEGRPVIGISWGSKSHTKDVPGFAEWTRLMREVPATFVSLQYGEVSGALRKLRRDPGVRLIEDPSVDQLIDMDRFAAQVSALDAVVSVSNTAAHLAGALNVPAVVLVDDRFHTVWPVTSRTTPWYPSVTVLLNNGRPWSEVLAEAGQELTRIIDVSNSSRPTNGDRLARS
jgi:hypothetical protein